MPQNSRKRTGSRARGLIAAFFWTLIPVMAWPEDPNGGADAPLDATTLTPGFEQLLAESGMMFETPNGLAVKAVRPSRLFPYDRALASPDGALEIRYAVRPLGRIVIDYQDPHSATPDPNHMFPVMFQSAVTLLSGGGHSPTREYPPDQARDKFNADWAAAAAFDVIPELEADHRQGLLLALHKNKLADAYVIFLFDDHALVRERLNSSLRALRFIP